MFNTEELKRIWLGKTFHWSTKVRILEKYHKTKKEEDSHWSENKTAAELNTSSPVIWQALRLAAIIREFPTLSKIPRKTDAINLVQKYSDKSVTEFRKVIKQVDVKYINTEQYHRLRRELIQEGIDPDDLNTKESDNEKKIEFSDPMSSEFNGKIMNIPLKKRLKKS